MERLTRPIDEYPCRLKDVCGAEKWIEEVSGYSMYNWKSEVAVCENCPFEKIINRLGELEDKEENYERSEQTI